jgi:hypothetical protein
MSVDMFPIAFPITQWVEVSAGDPLRRQAAGVLASGRDFVIDRGIPYWKFTAKTRMLFQAEINLMLAFKAKLRGAARFCTLWDPTTQYPAAYMPAGPPAMNRATLGTAFDGHCSLGAIANSGLDGVGRDIITIGAPDALPTGLALIAGDKIELRQGSNLLTSALANFTSGWSAANMTLTANAGLAPDGNSTAACLVASAANAYIRTTFPENNPATWYRVSFWARLDVGTVGNLQVLYEDDTGADVTLDTFTPTGVWTRFEFTAFMPAGAAPVSEIYFKLPTAASGGTLYLWNPMITEVDEETVSLHRVLDTTQLLADSNGNLVAWIEPEVPASFTAGFGGALANVFNARGKFRILDMQIPVNAQGRARPGQCTFTAISTLL